MLNELQMTIEAVMGAERFVPTRLHPDDYVECVGGAVIPLRDAFTDCRGGYHSDDDGRRESNVAIVTEVLDARLKGAEEYATDNEDYADGYAGILSEGSHAWKACIEEWVNDNYFDYDGWKQLLVENEDCIDHDDFDAWKDSIDAYNIANEGDGADLVVWTDYVDDRIHRVSDDSVIEAMFEGMTDCDACDVEYNRCEWHGYDGDGCCIDGFAIGEIEEQVDFSCHPELQALHELGELDDCLDDYKGEAWVNRDRRRVKNESTGKYELVGRDTYDPYGSDYPTIDFYHDPGGRWDFVVPVDRMNELFQGALIRLFESEVS